MKKVLILFITICFSISGFADVEKKDSTIINKNKDGLQIGIWFGANNSGNENLDCQEMHNFFYMNRHTVSAGGMLMISKEFSKILGWRASLGFYNNRGNANYWEYPKLFDDSEPWYYNFQDAEIFGDLTLDLTDLFAPNRNKRFNLKLFAGVGGAYVFGYPEASDFNTNGTFMLDTDPRKIHYGGRVGLNASWRLSDKWRLGLQESVSMFDDMFSGGSDDKFVDTRQDLLVGLVYTIPSKTRVRVERETVVEPVIVQQQDTVVAPVEEPAPVVVPEPEPEPAPVVVEQKPAPVVTQKVLEELTIPLFFALRESNILPDHDTKIQKLVDFVNAHNTTKITIKGYADKGTGNPRVNVGYSKSRATKTAAELIRKYHVSEEQLEVTWYGDTVQPYEENDLNRCSILSVKETE